MILINVILMFLSINTPHDVYVKNDVYYIPTKIGSSLTKDFLLDTGATYSAINEKILETLLQLNEATYINKIKTNLADGTKVIFKLYEINLMVGNCKSIKTLAIILPDDIRPILGLTTLKQLSNMTINFDTNTISFENC